MSTSPSAAVQCALPTNHGHSAASHQRGQSQQERVATAVVHCESNSDKMDGETANGLVRRSEKYELLAVIGSRKAGSDAGMVPGEAPKCVPICLDRSCSVATRLRSTGFTPTPLRS